MTMLNVSFRDIYSSKDLRCSRPVSYYVIIPHKSMIYVQINNMMGTSKNKGAYKHHVKGQESTNRRVQIAKKEG